MYFYLSEQVQRLFIQELRAFWQFHPEYKDHLVDNIQGKYSFKERPQMGIVLKNSSTNHVSLAADNYQGVVEGYAYLAAVEGKPSVSLEWVRDDQKAIQLNDGFFPTPPGVYFIDFCTAEGTPTTSEFFIDPLLEVEAETLLKVNDLQYQLLQGKFVAGTLRLFQMRGNRLLEEGTDYTADPATGMVELTSALPEKDYLSADYRYPGESTGPWSVQKERGYVEPLPGVVLGFGRRIFPGDRAAVVVQRTRDLAALEYGGQWEMTLDADIIARDIHAQHDIMDFTMMYLWTIARPRLSSMGIQINQISSGGDSEETYDENADDYFYTGSLSIQIQTDWSVQVPLGITLRRIDPTSQSGFGNASPLTTDPIRDDEFGLVDDLGRVYDPFYIRKKMRGNGDGGGTFGTGGMIR